MYLKEDLDELVGTGITPSIQNKVISEITYEMEEFKEELLYTDKTLDEIKNFYKKKDLFVNSKSFFSCF